MTCEGIHIQISDLLDASLDVEQVKKLEQHLESCAGCARFYQEELELAEWLREAGNFQLEPPPTIWKEIDSHINAEPPRVPFLSFPLFNLRYALAGLVLVMGFFAALFTLYLAPRGDMQHLAELESYTLEVEGNPFLSQMRLNDSLFELDGQARENPFSKWGDLQ